MMKLMKTAIILHGTLGSPDSNWFQWLKKELEQRNFDVWLPQLPDSSQPSLKKWAQFVTENCPFEINAETLIIGHSSGAILALVLAEQNTEKLGAIVAVSVFHDNSLQWEPNDKLFDVQFDWTTIQEGVNKLIFIHSDNDPYVPLEQAEYVAHKTGGDLLIIPNQGHFNLEYKKEYERFPELLAIIEKCN